MEARGSARGIATQPTETGCGNRGSFGHLISALGQVVSVRDAGAERQWQVSLTCVS